MSRPPITVTILGPRGDEWERVVGTRTFPTLDWNPIAAILPGLGMRYVHRVNVQLLEPEILDRIIQHLCGKFGLTMEEARHEVETVGIPILADSCSVVLNDPQRWV